MAAVAVLAASTAIALRPSPFRQPSAAAVTSPKIAEARDDVTAAKAEPAPVSRPASAAAEALKSASANGPKIIHVAHGEGGDGATGGADVSAPGGGLSRLPDRSLIEESEMGPLPIRGADGRRPFDVYARPTGSGGGARIAIVIGGLGLSQTGTQKAIEKLPADVTLAFAPQGNSLDRWMRAARSAGHELVVQLPLEPYDYPNVNPGRNTLTVAASPSQALRELRWALSRVTNYVGVMNYMGARYTADRKSMKLLMDEIADRGLGYIDDGTSSQSLAGEFAAHDDVPFAKGDAVIDRSRDEGDIADQLAALEKSARANGTAIGIGSAFDSTIDAVADWMQAAAERGISVVPVSALSGDANENQVANGK